MEVRELQMDNSEPVYIGDQHERWRELKTEKELPTDRDVAKFLLDRYESTKAMDLSVMPHPSSDKERLRLSKGDKAPREEYENLLIKVKSEPESDAELEETVLIMEMMDKNKSIKGEVSSTPGYPSEAEHFDVNEASLPAKEEPEDEEEQTSLHLACESEPASTVELVNLITDILPKLKKEFVQKLLLYFDEVGVEEAADVALCELSEFEAILKKIPARKFYRAVAARYGNSKPTSNYSTNQENTVPPIEPSVAHDSDQSKSPWTARFQEILSMENTVPPIETFSGASSDEDISPWPARFKEILSVEMETKLQNGTITPSDRRQLVRILVDQIMEIEKLPKKRELTILATRLVLEYPVLQDTDGEEVIDNGCTLLVAQLMNRYDNLSRPPKRTSTVPPHGQPHNKRPRTTDRAVKNSRYGCVNWQPQLAEGETPEGLEEKRQALLHRFQSNPTSKDLMHLQKQTFYAQRCAINKGAEAEVLLTDWPTLFTTEGALTHCQQLTGVHVLNNMVDNWKRKCQSMLDFIRLTDKAVTNNILKEMDAVRGTTSADAVTLPGLFLAMNKYFGEKLESILIGAKSMSSAVDVEEALPPTPAIVYCGPSVLTAQRFMLTADRRVVHHQVQTFPVALALLYALYFNLNTKYCTDAPATMDFFQRAYAGINTKTGSKAGGEKHTTSVHPKVPSFYRKYEEFCNNAVDRYKEGDIL